MRLNVPLLAAAALAVATGTALTLQHQRNDVLREQIDLLHGTASELGRLQQEKSRLAASLPPADELARLRADRAAVERLRTEVDGLRTRVVEMEHRAGP